MWDYASLSKAAKAAGGPDAFLKAIKGFSTMKGAVAALPVGILIGITGKMSWDKKKAEAKREEEELLAACREDPAIQEIQGNGSDGAE